jgi:hypothetical protein
LRFDGDRELDVAQHAISATFGYARASGWSVRGSLGVVLGGHLDEGDRRHDIGPGLLAAAGVARQWTRDAWFVNGTVSASVSRVTTLENAPGAARQTLIGIDVARLGVSAGRTFGIVSPYLLARGFGGPALWRLDGMDVTGSDTHKFQLGAGATVTTAGGLSLVVDVSALGERSASLGVALRL